jgi:hypothetical protein
MSTQLSLLQRTPAPVLEPLTLVVSNKPVAVRQRDRDVVGPAEAAHMLGISRRSLDRVLHMVEASGAAQLLPPTAGVGAGRRHWRWRADELKAWWKEVNEWRASTSATADGESDGVILMGKHTVASVPTMRRRKRSVATSSGPSPRAVGGSLVTLARSLTSGK